MQYLKKHLKIALAGAALISVPAWAMLGDIDEQVDCMVVQQGKMGQAHRCRVTGEVLGNVEDYYGKLNFTQVAGIGSAQVAFSIQEHAHGTSERYTLNGQPASTRFRTKSGSIVSDPQAFYQCIVPRTAKTEFCFSSIF